VAEVGGMTHLVEGSHGGGSGRNDSPGRGIPWSRKWEE
jgi:hypothetical protein